MVETVTISVEAKYDDGVGALLRPISIKEVVDAYNFQAMKEGESSIGEEDVTTKDMPEALGVYRIGLKGASFKLWVVRATPKTDFIKRSDIEQGLCSKDAVFSKGTAAYVWNDSPQLAVLKVLDDYDYTSSHPYKVNLYGTSLGFQHACLEKDGHPARNLIKELMGIFPKETYGPAALSKGQAAILLEWASRLPVVFRDGMEGLVKTTIQDGVIVIEERKD